MFRINEKKTHTHTYTNTLLYHEKLMLCFFSWHSSCTAVPQLLPVQAPRLMNNLTRLGKQAMNDDRCDHCAQHEHDDDSCCFHPREHSLAIGRKSRALPRSRRRHRTRERTAFSAVFRGPGSIQATSAVECDLWYGVRRPYVGLVCRCYTDLERAKKLES